jgi:NADH-quinone oxidoreductase subunit N
VTGFISTALKVAAFAAFVRISAVFFKTVPIEGASNFIEYLHGVIWVLALLTMVIGNFVALLQDNLKRMLAYSAIAHTGYLMLGILVGPKVGYSGLLVYFIPYCVMNIGAFAVISIFSGKNDENAKIDSLAGIGYRHPFLGATMAVFLFSLAGLPPTGGFVGKYFLFSSALEGGEIILVLLAVVTSLVSVYYYLRVIIFMYMREPKGEISEIQLSRAGGFSIAAISLCCLLVLYSGVSPAGIVHMARKASIALSL